MKCEELEVFVSAYIDGELEEPERLLVEEHLTGCEACGELLADFSQMHSLYGELEELQAPVGFRERVTQRIDTPSRSWFGGGLKRPALRYAFSFLLLLAFVGGVWLWQAREHASLQTEETRLAGEIEVFAEDVLFGEGSSEDAELLSSEDESVADGILNDLFAGESDTSGLSGIFGGTV